MDKVLAELAAGAGSVGLVVDDLQDLDSAERAGAFNVSCRFVSAWGIAGRM